MARLVRALAALGAAPLLLVLVGCGAGGEGTTAASPVRQAGPTEAVPTPTARATPPTRTSPARGSGPTTSLFFGDSYIVGGAYTGSNNSMGAIAARRLGWSYEIRGGGGTGFVSGNPDYNIANFLGQIRNGALDVGPVDWLVIEGGGNDKHDAPGLVTRRAVKTLKAAAKRHPEARLVLVGTMDPTVDSFRRHRRGDRRLGGRGDPARDPLHQRAALAGGPAGPGGAGLRPPDAGGPPALRTQAVEGPPGAGVGHPSG